MNLDAQAALKRRRFQELMQAGRDAYQQGNRKLAHDHWHEAATLDPYNEQVWLSLYHVLDSQEDRIACLENIIAINPMNVQARRRLNAYQQPATDDAAPAKAAHPTKRRAKTPPPGAKARTRAKPAAKPRRRLGRILALIVVAVLIGLLLAVVASILLFGQ